MHSLDLSNKNQPLDKELHLKVLREFCAGARQRVWNTEPNFIFLVQGVNTCKKTKPASNSLNSNQMNSNSTDSNASNSNASNSNASISNASNSNASNSNASNSNALNSTNSGFLLKDYIGDIQFNFDVQGSAGGLPPVNTLINNNFMDNFLDDVDENTNFMPDE